MLNILRNLFRQSSLNLKEKVNDGAILVDVRTPVEYADTTIKGTVNIPLERLRNQFTQLRNKKHIVVFCRSGFRSAQARSILEANGFTNVIDAGSWHKVKKELDVA